MPVRRGPKRTVKIFVSYAHLDKVWMQRLKPLLEGLHWDGRNATLPAKVDEVKAWHDKDLKKGDPFDPAIHKELDEMHIFVPLVSPHFFASWYVQEIEIKKAEERFTKDKIKVLPILLYKKDLREKCPFLHKFPSVPEPCWSHYKADLVDAMDEIEDALWEMIRDVAKTV